MLRDHQFTISGGLAWLGGYSIGGNTATLRRNETGTTSPSTFTLFRADGSVERAASFEARLGFALTPTFALELGGAYGTPRIAIAVAQDAEGEPVTIADGVMSQYTVDASAVWQLPVRLGRRASAYVTGGGGYLRQLYDERAAVETGTIIHAGGGVRYWLRGADRLRRPLGIRAELRLQTRTGGIDLAGERRTFPVMNLFAFFGF